jgi:NitT/TauT family transport system substrate-binding protein
MSFKGWFHWGTGGLLAGLLLAGCSKPADPAATAPTPAVPGEKPLLKVGFQLDWFPAAEHGGHYQALVKGFYRDAGLDVTIIPGGPGQSGMQKVALGQVEFAMGRSDDVILAVSHGLPLLIIGAQMQHDPQAILVHDESRVKTFQDLDGKSIMVNPGSNWITFVQVHYGIHFGTFPNDFGLARFMADPGFIQQCFISNEPYYVGQHGVKTRTLLIADAGYDPYRVIFTSQAFAKEHPEAVRAFMAASVRGWTDYLHGDSTPAATRIQQENQTQTPGLIAYSIDAMKSHKLVEGDPAKGERTGLITPARMTSMVNTLVQLQVLSAPMALDDFVRFEFVPPPSVAPAKDGPAPATAK